MFDSLVRALADLSLVLKALLAGLLILPIFPVLYVFLRWRGGGREEEGAGLRAAVLYFLTVATLVILGAASNLIYGFLSTTPANEETRRLSWGMLCAGALFHGIHAALARGVGLGPSRDPARRVFGGFFVLLSGMVAFGAMIFFFTTLFRESSEARTDDLKLWLSWGGVWLLAYLGGFSWLRRR